MPANPVEKEWLDTQYATKVLSLLGIRTVDYAIVAPGNITYFYLANKDTLGPRWYEYWQQGSLADSGYHRLLILRPALPFRASHFSAESAMTLFVAAGLLNAPSSAVAPDGSIKLTPDQTGHYFLSINPSVHNIDVSFFIAMLNAYKSDIDSKATFLNAMPQELASFLDENQKIRLHPNIFLMQTLCKHSENKTSGSPLFFEIVHHLTTSFTPNEMEKMELALEMLLRTNQYVKRKKHSEELVESRNVPIILQLYEKEMTYEQRMRAIDNSISFFKYCLSREGIFFAVEAATRLSFHFSDPPAARRACTLVAEQLALDIVSGKHLDTFPIRDFYLYSATFDAAVQYFMCRKREVFLATAQGIMSKSLTPLPLSTAVSPAPSAQSDPGPDVVVTHSDASSASTPASTTEPTAVTPDIEAPAPEDAWVDDMLAISQIPDELLAPLAQDLAPPSTNRLGAPS